MTNIWADLYKEIREPFFEMADPYAVTEEKKVEVMKVVGFGLLERIVSILRWMERSLLKRSWIVS